VRTFDALVIGAGPAGATAALLLARAGWSVAIVEKAAFPRRKVCGEYISATSWPMLRNLGIAADLEANAGPAVRRVGLFAGDTVIDAPMPLVPAASDACGRAIERELLDTALLERARQCGAEVWQPCSVEHLRRVGEDFQADVVSAADRPMAALRARLVIAAHGSWEHGELPTQTAKPAARASDLLGFKAHFTGSTLETGLMPLVLFPGGYGGMVHAGRGRVSFSCCIRRDALAACRKQRPGLGAGEAVIAHVMDSCRGVRESLAAASLADPWLSAGPIRPGIRTRARNGLFAIGNAAGEAHPLVAEGISMAIQSAWLLCESLLRSREDSAFEYSGRWRRHFATRVRASAVFAALTTSPRTAAASAAFMKHVPAMLTWGARWSGKAHTLRMDSP
jgi:2-polyprenyl-6-methoxyphenol hydroxylase-like FAD-dependent oxidoreductase